MSIYTDSPVIEVNTHGLYVEEALKAVDKAVKSAGKGVYKIIRNTWFQSWHSN